MGHLVDKKLELHRGLVNDSLAQLQLAPGNLAILYRQNLQSTNSIHTEMRTCKAILESRNKAFRHVQSCSRAQNTMIHLCASKDILATHI
ncbi:hypothetical protein PAXRUDRAFT_168550 [Paxillus rubicundulus Ve08.2h10]|uniref:Uncharacterized protein n=1 Tax=Paxillus rubicundulus Ve08.2h10 TaxID=930991 RepID=A0A0D0DG75_9AGAM|nr:hypothetical protein PAXRUDRAFT_168550 [Paxillus rubicundulus Ve08.2h10]